MLFLMKIAVLAVAVAVAVAVVTVAVAVAVAAILLKELMSIAQFQILMQTQILYPLKLISAPLGITASPPDCQ